MPRIAPGFARIRLIARESAPPISSSSAATMAFTALPDMNSWEWSRKRGHAWIGQRVAGEINLACGKCEWCARVSAAIAHTEVLGIVDHPGAFQEFLTLRFATFIAFRARFPMSTPFS